MTNCARKPTNSACKHRAVPQQPQRRACNNMLTIATTLLTAIALAGAPSPIKVAPETAAVTEPANPKYDCLAGVCLNARAINLPAKMVTVADMRWQRTVEICEERIVAIHIGAAWQQDGLTFSNLLPAATTPSGQDGGDRARVAYDTLDTALRQLGWAATFVDKLDAYGRQGNVVTVLWHKPNTSGTRGLSFERSTAGPPTGWVVSLSTLHPDSDQVCAPKRLEGL